MVPSRQYSPLANMLCNSCAASNGCLDNNNAQFCLLLPSRMGTRQCNPAYRRFDTPAAFPVRMPSKKKCIWFCIFAFILGKNFHKNANFAPKSHEICFEIFSRNFCLYLNSNLQELIFGSKTNTVNKRSYFPNNVLLLRNCRDRKKWIMDRRILAINYLYPI